jgi:hypothetical protein
MSTGVSLTTVYDFISNMYPSRLTIHQNTGGDTPICGFFKENTQVTTFALTGSSLTATDSVGNDVTSDLIAYVHSVRLVFGSLNAEFIDKDLVLVNLDLSLDDYIPLVGPAVIREIRGKRY